MINHESRFSRECKTIMTWCALSFQNETKLSNNHSEMSKLNFNQLLHFFFNCRILTTDLNCIFSSKKCFLSAA